MQQACRTGQAGTACAVQSTTARFRHTASRQHERLARGCSCSMRQHHGHMDDCCWDRSLPLVEHSMGIQGVDSGAAHPQVQAVDEPATAAGRAQRYARQLQQRRARPRARRLIHYLNSTGCSLACKKQVQVHFVPCHARVKQESSACRQVLRGKLSPCGTSPRSMPPGFA